MDSRGTIPVNTLHETGLDSGGGSVECGRSRIQSREDEASSVGHTQILHVEVDDIMTWFKMNVGIGRTFFCKFSL